MAAIASARLAAEAAIYAARRRSQRRAGSSMAALGSSTSILHYAIRSRWLKTPPSACGSGRWPQVDAGAAVALVADGAVGDEPGGAPSPGPTRPPAG